jgi:prepilin-type N-terminal cleavage/methylation domain-containing protein
MIAKMKQISNNHNNNCGFTMIELAVVLAIIGVLTSMAVKSFVDSRIHVLDAVALAEAQGLGKAVLDTFLEGENVDLTHNPGDGPRIGSTDNDGNGRSPVFQFSPGVRAEISGGSEAGGNGNGLCDAKIYHANGSKWYFLYISEDENITDFPDI